MKKISLILAALLIVLNSNADINGFKLKGVDKNATMGLFLCFSGVDSKYEDDNVIFEIYGGILYATNKTNKTLFLDLSQCFNYINEVDVPWYTVDTGIKKKTNTVSEDQFFSLAPRTKSKALYNLNADWTRNYTAFDGKKALDLPDKMIEFMNAVDELRHDVEQNQANSASKHFTKDEAFATMGVALAYDTNKKFEDPTNIMIETWVSDLILAKTYPFLPEEIKKEKSLAAKRLNDQVIFIGANQPYEFDEEKNPIIATEIEIDPKNASFNLTEFNTVKENKNVLLKGFAILAAPLTGGGSLGLLIGSSNQQKVAKNNILKFMPDLDFSKIKDDHKGHVEIGKDNPMIFENKYN